MHLLWLHPWQRLGQTVHSHVPQRTWEVKKYFILVGQVWCLSVYPATWTPACSKFNKESTSSIQLDSMPLIISCHRNRGLSSTIIHSYLFYSAALIHMICAIDSLPNALSLSLSFSLTLMKMVLVTLVTRTLTKIVMESRPTWTTVQLHLILTNQIAMLMA